ncbi:hypothetical protein BGZ57DRAFT_919722, partial [Hyaloscypha finlandica]
MVHSGLDSPRASCPNFTRILLRVKFFSKEWKRLGDKQSLGQIIHKITRIPELALQGASLFQLEEDMAYSLLGIFGVYIPPIYGEGTGGASNGSWTRLASWRNVSKTNTADCH